MKTRPRDPKGDTMVRRTSPIVAVLMVILMTVVAAVPAFAYGHANDYHLRLSRMDRISCSVWIGLKATLTTSQGKPVRGVNIDFSILTGAPHDALNPWQTVTDRRGRGYTHVKLDCTANTHVIVASVTGEATAQITLITQPRVVHPHGHSATPSAVDLPPFFAPWLHDVLARLVGASA